MRETEADIGVQLDRRRREVVERWQLTDELVLVGAGSPIHVPGRGDLTYRFRSHSEYLYLTDRERPRGVLAFDPAEGWVDFVAPVTRAERLWEGASPDDGDGTPLDELKPWLAARAGRRIAVLGTPPEGVASDPELEERVREALNYVRRQKDELELARIRVAEEATRAG